MLSDAEMLLGLGRHLSAYSIGPAHAALESLHFGGQIYEMAWRLRNSQVSNRARIEAIAVEAHIGSRVLFRDVLPTMRQLGWVDFTPDTQGVIHNVEAIIPPNDDLIKDAERLIDILMATPVQRAALALLRATTLQPLPVVEAKQVAAVHGDEAADEALRHLESVQLVRRVEIEVDRPVVFNPNVWTGDEEVARAALKAQDARASKEVGALLEEVAANPGIPVKHVKSTSPKWIDFAVSQGLVERSVVQTSSKVEEGFLFSPHLKRSAFGATSGDPSGHVRQLVGSMIYASTFATWKLNNPGGFLYSLIRDGEAGNVKNIGTDYPMLETAGTIRVAPGRSNNSFKMVLLQSEIAESALSIMDSREQTTGGDAHSLQTLGDQRAYSHLERERARMATDPTADDAEAARLVAALRDVTAGGSFGR